jgi:hypothetical protein
MPSSDSLYMNFINLVVSTQSNIPPGRQAYFTPLNDLFYQLNLLYKTLAQITPSQNSSRRCNLHIYVESILENP